ncbi:YAP1 (predicted) [Pycnogonum litorale]
MSLQRNSTSEQPKSGTQVVHVMDSNLDALFDAVMHPKDGQIPLQVPMKLRNLPQSFFKPPDTGSKSVSHSRESSADSNTLLAGPVGSPSPQLSPSPGVGGLQIHHPRAHSSPASLQQTYNANTSQHQHLRQQSYDIIDDGNPLPAGWEMAKTPSGQKYFLNHITQTTQWEDPRRKLTASVTANIQHANNNNNPPPPPPPPQSGNVAVNQSGQSPQGPNPVTASSGTNINPQSLGTLPEGWEQAVTPEGEMYFINHHDRSTSWFDPRIPAHLQRPILANQGPAPGQLPGASSGMSLIQQRQQKLRLQRLQIERERLRIRQQEILRQAGHPQNLLNSQQQSQSCGELMIRRDDLNNASSPSSESSTVTGMDPFLGQVNSNTSSTATTPGSDYHSRQESTDSGLGMGPGSYNIPTEDFLSNMDEGMDSTNTDENQTPNLSTLSLGGPEDSTNMDSDDLVPSLQEELSTDILKDVEALLNTNKMDNVLTWL